jgi:hypothetical protein
VTLSSLDVSLLISLARGVTNLLYLTKDPNKIHTQHVVWKNDERSAFPWPRGLAF